jgi:hypothetical protein
MLRAERANAKEREGDNSSITMRGTSMAPMAAAERAAEKLKGSDLIHSKMTK